MTFTEADHLHLPPSGACLVAVTVRVRSTHRPTRARDRAPFHRKGDTHVAFRVSTDG